VKTFNLTILVYFIVLFFLKFLPHRPTWINLTSIYYYYLNNWYIWFKSYELAYFTFKFTLIFFFDTKFTLILCRCIFIKYLVTKITHKMNINPQRYFVNKVKNNFFLVMIHSTHQDFKNYFIYFLHKSYHLFIFSILNK
jgi:hypothetical protein